MKFETVSPDPPVARERRYLTIVFCDLVGYTQLSEWMDPEDLRDLQLEYQREALTAMEDYGGFVAAYSGDGILVYFGYPTAHENDAERAVRAALDLLRRMPGLKAKAPDGSDVPLAVRIGVHTGLLVIGSELMSMGRHEYGVVGEPVNLAARLKEGAPVNSLVVSHETLELVEGLFDSEPLGDWQIRGLSRPVAVHKIVGARHTAGRTSGRTRRGATELVGRAEQRAALQRHWHDALNSSKCKVVQIVGEAGVGKTRLAEDFSQNPEVHDGAVVLRLNCLELFSSTPLYAVAGFFWSRVGLAAEDDEPARNAKISAYLGRFDANTMENAASLANVLGFVLTRASKSPAATPQAAKQEQFTLLTWLFEQIVRRRPAVLWLDDAHWLDPSSAELLGNIVEQFAGMPLLVLLTMRSYPKGPTLRTPDHVIRLDQLDWDDCLRLARSIPGAQAVSEDLLARAAANCDGIPLFIEQMVLSLASQRQEGRRQTPSDLPLTLAEMMSERLDRHEGGRSVVQAAACLGRSFASDFLGALLYDGDARVIEPLEALAEAEILRRRHDDQQTTYEFRHALLQRVAYESITQADRRTMHSRIADLLERRSQIEPVIPEVKAHHLTRAGRSQEAIDAWLEAAARASRRSALVEAIADVRNGLSLIGGIEPPERRLTELKLQTALMGPLSGARGATSDELSACCERGMELSLAGEPSAMAFPFMFGRISFFIARGQTADAIALADRFIALAEQMSDDAARVVGQRLAAMAYFQVGDLPKARENAERSIASQVAERDEAATQRFGQDIHLHSQCLLALILFFQGEVDKSLELVLGALRTAEQRDHAHTTALALSYAGLVVGFSGEPKSLAALARRLGEVSERHVLGPFAITAKAFLGWSLYLQGHLVPAIGLLEQAIAESEASGTIVGIVRYLTLLADARRRSGQLKEAHAAYLRATELFSADTRAFHPELFRVGALISRDHGSKEAEELFERAIRSARDGGVPLFELRALLDLKTLGVGGRSDLDARIAELAPVSDVVQRAEAAMRAHAPTLYSSGD